MKPKSNRRFFGMQSAPSLAFITAITSFTGSATATTYRWQGTTDTQWTTASNWDANGIAPTGALAAGHRLSVNNADAAKPCTYTAAQGYSTFGGVSGVRGLVVGSASNGSMVITGGTFESLTGDGTNTDVIGNSTGTGVLTIDGGAYIGSGLGTTFGVLTGASGNGTLTVNSGSASLSLFTCNAGAGAVNLNGGTLSMDRMVFASGTNVVNLNGGNLKPKASSSTFIPDSAGASVNVKLGGAIIDTDGFNITIGEPLLEDSGSTGGGITKNGLGVLTLGAVSTTTGPATINGGGLALTSGATSWAPSSLSHSGDQLDFNFGTYNGGNPVPVNTGAVTLDSTVNVNITGSGFPLSGQVKLLEYTSKSGAGTLQAGTMPAGLEAATIEENTVDGYFYLDIPLPSGNNFVWSKGTGDWDDVSLNWNGNSEAYSEPAFVTFPDLTGGGTVTLTGVRSPLVVTINNATGNDYIFDGSALSGSATLTKEGTGSATFTNSVTLTGGYAINGGKLSLSAMPDSPLFTIGTGASLEINRATNQDRNIKNLTITGGGTFTKSGSGNLALTRFQGDATPYVWSLGTGSQIRVEGGLLKVSDYNTISNFSNNHSSLHISSGATFEGLQSEVTIDALSGDGVYQGGWFGPRKLIIGIDGGSGTFSGTIQGNGTGAEGSVPLIKRGNGAQILNGTLNFRGAYGSQTLSVRDGTVGSPSSLTISPVGASVIGVDSESIYFSPGTNDVTEVTQTAGTIVAGALGLAENGQGTYNFSGGLVNTKFLSFAFSGGGNNGPAIMNISDSAQMNINQNGDIRMGVFYGRSITINQTGGEVVQFSDSGSTRGGTGRLNFSGGNQNTTWNLSGGTLSLAGMAWQAASGGGGGGNGVLNLNGGTLQITNAAFAAPTGDANGKPKVAAFALGDEVTANSGAIFDNYGLNVTFAAPILHGPVGVFDGGLKLATSVAGGSLTLSGINTYTGNTTVVTGNTLVLADNAALAFVLEGSASNKITGAGAITINGDFTIDTAGADLTNGNTWTLVDAPIPPGTFTSTFTIAGFSEAGTSGIHTKTEGANTWTFNEGTGVLSLTVVAGYSTWISNFPAVGGLNQPGDDAEFDGTENLLEYVLNGNPTVSDPGILPSLDASGANFVFTFTRLEQSVGDTTQVFQYGSDLSGWTTVNITAPTGPEVALGTLGVPSAGLRTVTVTIPKSVAVGGKLFGRLKASQP